MKRPACVVTESGDPLKKWPTWAIHPRWVYTKFDTNWDTWRALRRPYVLSVPGCWLWWAINCCAAVFLFVGFFVARSVVWGSWAKRVDARWEAE